MEILASRRITRREIISTLTRFSGKEKEKCALWELAHSNDHQTSINALWILTYLCKCEKEWISSLSDEMIDMLLVETDKSKKRMLLQILRELEYDIDDLRTDFLDYCLSRINSECESYAVRAYCIHIAFKMCRHYPELTAELEERLGMLSFQPLSPGLASARSNTLKAIQKLLS